MQRLYFDMFVFPLLLYFINSRLFQFKRLDTDEIMKLLNHILVTSLTFTNMKFQQNTKQLVLNSL